MHTPRHGLILSVLLLCGATACIPGEGVDRWDDLRGVWAVQSYGRTPSDQECGSGLEDIRETLEEDFVASETLGKLANADLWIVGCPTREDCGEAATTLRGGRPPESVTNLEVARHLDPVADGDVGLNGCEARPFPSVIVQREGELLTVTNRSYLPFTLEEPCTEDAVRERLDENCSSETVLEATLVDAIP